MSHGRPSDPWIIDDGRDALSCMELVRPGLVFILVLAGCGGEGGPLAVADSELSGRLRVRVGTFNVQALGSTRSDQFDAAARIVERVDADVLCLQEVEEDEYWRLRSLARRAGYPHYFMGGVSSAMAGGLANACLSRFPIVEARSFTSRELSSDDEAFELGRDIVAIVVEPRPDVSMAVVNLHLKSGFSNADRFRREVEARRAVAAVDEAAADVAVVLGDFNEVPDGRDLGQTFTWFPRGLPRRFHLGADLRFPIRYDPFATFAEAGFLRSRPTQEDSTWKDGTRIPSSRRIDYVLFRGGRFAGDEVYEACADNGRDDGRRGGRLWKAGAPLPCGTSLEASDHRPVLLDLYI